MFVSDPATGTDLSTIEVMSPRLGFKFRAYREMGPVWVKMKNGTIFGMVFSVSNQTMFFKSSWAITFEKNTMLPIHLLSLSTLSCPGNERQDKVAALVKLLFLKLYCKFLFLQVITKKSDLGMGQMVQRHSLS
jgi:hypothetical protein